MSQAQEHKESTQPKISWNVNKEVDEQGNIIRYDSTYSWSYSNGSGNTQNINTDSLLQSFNSFFNNHYSPLWNESFINPFEKDSMWNRDFFKDDYFHSRWESNFFDMESMFLRMDSLRNLFFQEMIPENRKSEHDKGTKL